MAEESAADAAAKAAAARDSDTGSGRQPPSSSRGGEVTPHGAPNESRRRFLRGAGGAAAGGMFGGALLGVGSCASGTEARAAAQEPAAPAAKVGPEQLSGTVEVELAVNGTVRKVAVEPRTTLLDALRTRLDPALTGTKSVCERGNCGACTVLVDGEPRYACLQLACDLRGRAITTVEGLGTPAELSVLQQEFVAHDGSMCGFCTPGFVVAITACLRKDPRASEEAIRQSCAGNLCRCGTQPQIFEAALAAGRRLAENR